MKDQIVKIIADYLNKVEVPKEKWDGTVGFFPAEWPLPTCTIADEIAEKLAAAIALLVNAQAQDFAGWICHQVVAGRTYHKLWLDYCEEKAIAPHLEAGAGDDSQYTDNFLKWRKKYFKPQTETTYFVSKHSNERVSNEDLETRFARAMREDPKK